MSNWLNSKCSCMLRCKRADVVGSQFWSTLCKRHYRELVASNLAASYCKMEFGGIILQNRLLVLWAYLSVEEFESLLGMMREEFYKLPKWKQDLTKKKASRIILAPDGDAPGQALAEELLKGYSTSEITSVKLMHITIKPLVRSISTGWKALEDLYNVC
ncbi:putative villin headpiece, TOPRIM domain, villin headpiece domain superfamily [Helianthus annuus]|nr:putative villin headpiece, TOPRIM domain, villin headpiece domain superfamily [Helianthus annuus]